MLFILFAFQCFGFLGFYFILILTHFFTERIEMLFSYTEFVSYQITPHVNSFILQIVVTICIDNLPEFSLNYIAKIVSF